MKERVAGMRWIAVRSPIVIVPGLLVATSAAAADAMPDLLANFNFGQYFDFTTFNWPTVLLAGAIGLLIIALVAKVVMAARPTGDVESPQAGDASWRRIGNMPAEPPETTEAARRPVERGVDARRGVQGPMPPGFPV